MGEAAELELEQLMTTEQVAKKLLVTPRQVRKLPIRFIRIGVKKRRYRPDDVRKYLAAQDQGEAACQSSNAGVRRTTSRISKSPDVGFAEALKRRPDVMR